MRSCWPANYPAVAPSRCRRSDLADPTINSLATALVNPDAEALRPVSGAGRPLNRPIAVIGWSCRLPGDVGGDIREPRRM